MKKIISIFLAMLMTFACFGAVSVSAADLTASQQAIVDALPDDPSAGLSFTVANGGTGTGLSGSTAANSIDDILQALSAKYAQTKSFNCWINFSGDYVWDLSAAYTVPTMHWNTTIFIGGNGRDTSKLVFNNSAWVDFIVTTNVTFNKCTVVAIGNGMAFKNAGYVLTFGTKAELIDVMDMNQTVTVNNQEKNSQQVQVYCTNGAQNYAGSVVLSAGHYSYVFGSRQVWGDIKNMRDNFLTIGEGATVGTVELFRLNSTNYTATDTKPMSIKIDGTVNNFIFANDGGEAVVTVACKATVTLGPKANVKFAAPTAGFNFQFDTGATTITKGVHFKGGLTIDASALTNEAASKDIFDTLAALKSGSMAGMEVVHVKPVALQAGAATDSSIRILLGINAYEGLNASVEIEETSSVKAATVELTEVYTSVLAVDGTGITTVAATDKDVAYLMAVVITDLPVGVYNFDVTPIVNGVRGTTTTITHTVTASAT